MKKLIKYLNQSNTFVMDMLVIAAGLIFIVGLVAGFKGWAQRELARIDMEIAGMRAELNRQIDRTDRKIEITREQMDLLADVVFYDVPALPEIGLTPEEMHLVALVTMTEDNLHGMDGLKAVAQTVKNRLDDGRFGESVADICVPSQFHGLKNGDTTVSDEALSAVREVWEGEQIHDGLYFCTPETDPNLIKRGLIKMAEIGGHVYYTD